MKNPLFAMTFLGIAATLLADPSPTVATPPLTASAETIRGGAPVLWIAVHLPEATQPSWVGDDLADNFANRLVRALRDQGLRGVIVKLGPDGALPPQATVLEVMLSDWVDRDGLGDCAFRAALLTPQGTRSLGLFSGGSMIVTADGGYRTSSKGLRDAANFAMADLYSRLRATALVTSR